MKLKINSEKVNYRIAKRLFGILLVTSFFIMLTSVIAVENFTNITENSKNNITIDNISSPGYSAIPIIITSVPNNSVDKSSDRIGHEPGYEKFYKYLEEIDKYKANMTHSQEKIPSQILEMIDPNYPKFDSTQLIPDTQVILGMIDGGFYRPAASLGKDGEKTGDLFYVYIDLIPNTPLDLVDSDSYKVESKEREYNYVAAWVPSKNIEKIANMSEVRSISLVSLPEYQSGSVTTQGDIIHRTNEIRSNYGKIGTNQKVGIISDGVDSISSAVASGDLPSDVHVLSNSVGGDEGTAMLEIVYDMAPGASLYFHDSGANSAAFSDAVDELIANGCNVICDDVLLLEQPYFQDGSVATRINNAISANNLIYITAAGNMAQNHYEGVFSPDPLYPINHDFSRGGTNKKLFAQLPAGKSASIFLQWNNEWNSSSDDYDLYLLDKTTHAIIQRSENRQNGSNHPQEKITISNPTMFTLNYEIQIRKYSASDKTLELFTTQIMVLSPSSNIISSGSIVEHGAVPNVITVVSIDQGYPSGSIEPDSSQGPSLIYFPSYQSRNKPDITGVDDVLTSGAGNQHNPFIGTSAAAPHIAAIIADIWSAFPTKTPQELRTALYNSAVDISPAGWDTSSGYGRADAMAMYGQYPTPTPTPTPTPSPSWVSEIADSSGNTGLYSSVKVNNGNPAVSYEYIVTSDTGYLKYAWKDTGGWHTENVDTTNMNQWTSLAFNNGYPAISYLKYNAATAIGELRYAYKDGSGWHLESADGGSYSKGYYTSLAFYNGYPQISYCDVNSGDLKFAWKDGSGWHTEIADSTGTTGMYTSLVMNNGYPQISYYDATNNDLKFAYKDGSGWHTQTVDSSGNVGLWTSLAFYGGYPRISYYDSTYGDLKYAWKDGSGWHTEAADSNNDVGQYSSLALDSSGNPKIAYYGLTYNDLKFAWKDTGGWHTEVVQSTGLVGMYSSLNLTSTGNPRISYYDIANGDLRYAYK
jgi:hypothetical protein